MTKLSTYLRSVFFKYKTYLCSLYTIAITASVFKIVKAYNIKEIIDAIQSHNDITTLLMLFVLYTLMHYGMFFISRLLDIKYKPIILAETITDIYTRTLGHSLHWFDSHLSGEVSNKIKDFQDSITTLITHCFQVLVNITTIVISIFFLLSINLASAAVILVFITVYIPVIAFLLKKQMKLQEQCVTAGQATLGIINDSIANIFSVKIIGNMWTEFKLKVTPALLHWQDSDKRVREFDAYWVDSADTIMATIMYAVQIYLLAYLYQNGHITAGGFVFVSMITLGMHGEIDAVLTNLLFNINPRIASMKASFSFISRDYDTEDVPNAGSLTNVRGEIRFENVCFAYDQSRIIIHNFNLHICAGQKIGIVGISGAGKTTLIKCLLRYFDVQRGRILIDGYDIAGVTQESLWANLSVIPQDVTMFHRTILENLQLAKHDASFDEIIEACKKAKIHDNIMQMTNGYHSIVGERGIKVSGGQRQRIAIARAILKDAPILILDEATSALDTPTEQLVQESLNEVLETSNATAIVIAHRLSTLLHMDRILVFDQGKIVEDGTHQELLSKNGMYKTLWDTQVGGFLPEESGEVGIKKCVEEQS